jgi:hypothetical protein
MASVKTERGTSGETTSASERRLRDLRLVPAAAARVDQASAGAQARICSRAVEGANAALRLLDRLTAFSADSPPEDVTALKALMRSEFAELVGELSLGIGPRAERIEQIFSLLLDQLGALQEGIEDEDNLTKFQSLADCVASLYRSWNNVQQLFSAQTGIVLQQFKLVLAAAEEVRFTMDAVFIGRPERQTMMIPFTPVTGEPGVASLEELLGWVQDFAAAEGPDAIEATGGFALRNSILPAAMGLTRLAATALEARNLGRFPQRCSTPPLLRAMTNLQARLDELAWNC